METKDQHIDILIEGCKKNNQQAQLKMYNLYYKAMYNTSLRIVNNTFEAEDIMQESFLAAFTKINTFQGNVSFGAWLKKIVINKSITSIKKMNKYHEESLEVIKEIPQKNETESDYSLLKTTDILNAINNLKSNYKIALTLNLIEGYDYEEISQIMSISYENSRTTVSRAKNKLRQLLSPKLV